MSPNSHKLLTALQRTGIEAHAPDKPLYKYVDLDTCEKILSNRSFKFSSPLAFNDPFEFNDHLIDFTYNKSDLKKLIDRTKESMNNAHRRKLLNETLKTPTKVLKAYTQAFNKEKESCGVCCFSKAFDKTLMWSHYADKHTGVCLVFSINPLGNDNDFMMLSVRYTHEIKPINYFRDQDIVLFNWIFTKSHVWSYEEEVRLYLNFNGFVRFEKPCLKEIHFGVKTPEEKIRKIKQLIIDKGFQVNRITKMSIDNKTFDLRHNEI